MGSNKNPTHKTLAELKKANVSDESDKEHVDVNAIEDCHIMVEENSYGDWLIQEGIDMKSAVPLSNPDKVSPKITEMVDTEKKTKDICKIVQETNPADTVIDVNTDDAS